MAFFVKLPVVVMMAVLPTTAIAAKPAASLPCISVAQANAMFVTIMPNVLSAVQQRCAATLPATSFLKTQGPALLERYKADATAASAQGSGALLQMFGSRMPSSMNPAALMGFVGELTRSMVAGKVKTEDCANVDHAVEALAPLPANNLASLVTLIFEAKKPDADAPIRVCPRSD